MVGGRRKAGINSRVDEAPPYRERGQKLLPTAAQRGNRGRQKPAASAPAPCEAGTHATPTFTGKKAAQRGRVTWPGGQEFTDSCLRPL